MEMKCNCVWHNSERRAELETMRGEFLAKAFKLNQTANGRYATSWGEKTGRGVLLVAQHIINGTVGK